MAQQKVVFSKVEFPMGRKLLKINDKSKHFQKTDLTMEIVNLTILIWLISMAKNMTTILVSRSKYDTRINIGANKIKRLPWVVVGPTYKYVITSLYPRLPMTWTNSHERWPVRWHRSVPIQQWYRGGTMQYKPCQSRSLQFRINSQRGNSLTSCRHVISLSLLFDLNSKKNE